jgi:hypothetical protein
MRRQFSIVPTPVRLSALSVKSLFYSTGLAEGAETIAAFIAMCLWPQQFPAIALGFAALCLLTVVQRSVVARGVFGDAGS